MNEELTNTEVVETEEIVIEAPTPIEDAPKRGRKKKEDVVVTEETVAETPQPVAEKPKLTPAEIKKLLKEYSYPTLKARGII